MDAPKAEDGEALASAAEAVHPVNTMNRPVQVILDPEQRRRARRRAAELGLTLSDYIAGVVAADLAAWAPRADPPAVIPTADGASDLPARHGMYIGEAVAARLNRTDSTRGPS